MRYLAFTTILAVLTAFSFQQQNHTPVVRIMAPANHAILPAGSPISYQVSVSDKEDGDTKYDEINVKEILLQVSYAKNKNKLTALLKSPVGDDPKGLAIITG